MDSAVITVVYKTETSEPKRYGNCFRFSNGNLESGCHPGIELDVLLLVLSALKLVPKFVPVSSSKTARKLVESCRVDMWGNLRGQDNQVRYDLIALRAPILYQSTAFLLRKPTSGEVAWEGAVIRPFKTGLWLLIFGAIAAGTFAGILTDFVLRGKPRIFRNFLGVYRIFVKQEHYIERGKHYLPAVAICLSCVVLETYYCKVLLTHITIRKMNLRADTSNEQFEKYASERGFRLVTDEEDIREKYFENDPDVPEFAGKFLKDLTFVNSESETVEKILNSGQNYFSLTDNTKAAYWKRKNPGLLLSIHPFNTYFEYDSYLFCKNRSKLMGKFSETVTRINSLIHHAKKRYIFDEPAHFLLSDRQPVRLKAVNFGFAFISLIIGLAVSTVVFLEEFLRTRKTPGNMKKCSQRRSESAFFREFSIRTLPPPSSKNGRT